MNPTEERLRALAVSALAALRDLQDGYPWRELHVDVPSLLAEAKALGLEIDDE